MSDALHVLHSLASRIGPPVEAAARYLLGYALVGRFDSFCVQVKDRSWHVIRERGALVEEAGDEDGGEERERVVQSNEKPIKTKSLAAVALKVALMC